MTVSRVLGPDGINLGFVKDFWDILKDELLHFYFFLLNFIVTVN